MHTLNLAIQYTLSKRVRRMHGLQVNMFEPGDTVLKVDASCPISWSKIQDGELGQLQKP